MLINCVILVVVFSGTNLTSWGQDSDTVQILNFEITATENQLLSESYDYLWELENATGVTLESIPFNPYQPETNGAALVTYIFGETDMPTPGGTQPLVSNITLPNVDFFMSEGTYLVHLTAYGTSGKVTSTVLAHVYSDPDGAIEIENFGASYGSDDGILRIDTLLSFNWQVSNAVHTELQVIDNTDQLIKTYRLPSTFGVLDISASELIPSTGFYEVRLRAYTDKQSVFSYDMQLNFAPPLALPLYVQESWVEDTTPVRVCYTIEDDKSVQWRLENDNPSIISDDPAVKVTFDWSVNNVVGEPLQSESNLNKSGTTLLDTVVDYNIVVNTYLDIDNGTYRHDIGRTGAFIFADFACADS